MQANHLTADLEGCPPAPLLNQIEPLRALCLAAVARAGLQAVAECFHRFDGAGGVTGVVLLAESHLAVHTWPELAAVTLDVYVCNVSADHGEAARALLDDLVAAFAPQRCTRQALARGVPGPARPGRGAA